MTGGTDLRTLHPRRGLSSLVAERTASRRTSCMSPVTAADRTTVACLPVTAWIAADDSERRGMSCSEMWSQSGNQRLPFGGGCDKIRSGTPAKRAWPESPGRSGRRRLVWGDVRWKVETGARSGQREQPSGTAGRSIGLMHRPWVPRTADTDGFPARAPRRHRPMTGRPRGLGSNQPKRPRPGIEIRRQCMNKRQCIRGG